MKKFVCLFCAALFSACSLQAAFTGNYVYSGVMNREVQGLDDWHPAGTVTVKALKLNAKKKTCKVTVTIQEVGKRKLSSSGTLTYDGTYMHGTVKGAAGTWGCECLDEEEAQFSYDGDAYEATIHTKRNPFEGADANTTANKDALKPFLGVWNAHFCIGSSDCVISCTVKAKGVVSVKGFVWDGTKLNCTTKLGYDLWGEEASIPILVKPFAKNSSCGLTMLLKIKDGKLTWPDSDDYPIFAIRKPSAFFAAQTFDECKLYGEGAGALEGGRGSKPADGQYILYSGHVEETVNGVAGLFHNGYLVLATLGEPLFSIPVTVKGTAWTTPKAGKVNADGTYTGTNPIGLKVSYVASTRSYKGSHSVYLREKGKAKKYRATVNGVCFKAADGRQCNYGLSYSKCPTGSKTPLCVYADMDKSTAF